LSSHQKTIGFAAWMMPTPMPQMIAARFDEDEGRVGAGTAT